ncbi:MAG: hypothetical protein N2376_13675 [Clostridia bacterium]|nr:hypothetical protein [Clostridia bacterium]
MKTGFSGGMIIGAMVGAAISLIAEENFRMDRSWKAMNRAGKNIGRMAGRTFMNIRHMI